MLRSAALLAIPIGLVIGMDYHVSPSGDDTAAGTAAAPIATLHRAAELAGPGDTVLVHAGVYREPLIPQRSGAPGRPITFKAFGDGPAVISGSKLIDGLAVEGDVWVRRPWKKPLWTVDDYASLSDRAYPFRASARMENVFVNGVRLHWAPSRQDLRPGFFAWNEAELAIMPPDPSLHPDACSVECAETATLLGAWQGDPSTSAALREALAKNPAHEWASRQDIRDLSDIVVSGFIFQRGDQILNRAGVRSNGPRWLIEDCVVEQMNAIGIAVDADAVVRRCIVRWNGQAGLGNSGRGSRYEDVLAYGNNEKGFSISWGGGGNKLCKTENVVIERMVSCFNNGSGLWFDVDCAGVRVTDSLFFGNNNINAGLFWEISFDALFEHNTMFANRTGNADFYGAGVLLSCSSDAVVRDNLLLGGGGGIALGGARGAGADRTRPARDGRWVSKRNLVEGNMVVEPGNFALSLRDVADQAASSHEAANRIDKNTFVVKYGSQQVHYGPRWLDGIAAFEAMHAGLAQGNRVLDSIEALPAADRKRVSEAFRRMLGAIVRVFPEFPPVAANAALAGVHPIGNATLNPSLAWMVRSTDGCMALIDIAGGAATEFEFRTDGSSDGSATLWQFGSDGICRRSEVACRDGIVAGHASGALAIITGLPRGAYAPSQVISIRAPTEVAEDVPVPVQCTIGNPSDARMTIVVSGPGLAPASLDLNPGESRPLAITAELANGAKTLRYEAAIGHARPIVVEVPVRVVEALAVPAAGGMGLPGLSESERPFAVTLGAGQVAPGVYDEDTGERWDSPAGSSAQARLWWNATGLLLHIVVNDDRVVVNPDPARAYLGDSVELFLDARDRDRGAPQYGAGVLHLLLQPPPSSTWEAVPLLQAPTHDGSAEGRRRESGYEFRVLVPWTALGVADPQPGRRLGFDLIVNDSDRLKAGSAVRRSSLVWHGSPDDFRDPSRFGRIELGPK